MDIGHGMDKIGCGLCSCAENVSELIGLVTFNLVR